MVGEEVGVVAEKGLGGLCYRWLFSALLTAAILVFTAGCGRLFHNPPARAHGTIVLTMSREADVEPGSLRTAFLSEVAPLGDNSWPRSVEDVLDVLIGYRIRVQGKGVDVTKDALFEKGEDEVVIEITIPIGDNYDLTVLALGELRPMSQFNLLGAGRRKGISVKPEETTLVEVHMEPYQYNFEAPEQAESGAEIDIRYEVKGPELLNDLRHYTQLWYSVDDPVDDYVGSDVVMGESPTVSTGHWVWEFTLPGQSEPGVLCYQVHSHTSSQHTGKSVELLTPSISLGEGLPTILIGEGSGGMDVKPVW